MSDRHICNLFPFSQSVVCYYVAFLACLFYARLLSDSESKQKMKGLCLKIIRMQRPERQHSFPLVAALFTRNYFNELFAITREPGTG